MSCVNINTEWSSTLFHWQQGSQFWNGGGKPLESHQHIFLHEDLQSGN